MDTGVIVPVSGQYYGPRGTTVTIRTLVAGLLEFVPLPIAVPMSVDRLAVEVTTSNAGGNLRMGLYLADPLTGLPKTLLLDAGVNVLSATGARELTISQTLPQGLYWIACLAESSLGATRAISVGLADNMLGWQNATSAGAINVGLTATGVASGALPSTPPTLVGNANVTRMSVRSV
jgi:hypothetical protein